jgi:hypothetical protein
VYLAHQSRGTTVRIATVKIRPSQDHQWTGGMVPFTVGCPSAGEEFFEAAGDSFGGFPSSKELSFREEVLRGSIANASFVVMEV